MSLVTPAAVEALPQRLRAAAEVLSDSQPVPSAHGDPYADAGMMLEYLLGVVQRQPGGGRLWLLMVALTGEFPVHEDLEQARRMLELTSPGAAQVALLEQCGQPASPLSGQSTIDIITDRPVVDVDFSARHDLMTGIQRVVRQTVPRWMRAHSVELCTWTTAGTALRELGSEERRRLLAPEPAHLGSEAGPYDAAPPRVIVPWHVPMILPEVPSTQHVPRVAAMARHSGSPLGLIGYDCIPVISADLVEPHEHAKFIAYLNVVKYARTVACISSAAAEEFAGFVDMIAAQGIEGPRVLTCPLPNGAQVGESATADASTGAAPADDVLPATVHADGGMPTVLCVGSVDRRKNQIVVLEAAERLWREGLRFRLRFLGSGGVAPADFLDWSAELTAAGRPLTVESDVSDAALTAAIRAARFTVFVSLHEGYGLPIVESLTLGVPVIAAALGSMREVAEGDGAVLVDPRDVADVADAMRSLLTDDARLDALRALARSHPRRSWDDYAADVWGALLGEQAQIA